MHSVTFQRDNNQSSLEKEEKHYPFCTCYIIVLVLGHISPAGELPEVWCRIIITSLYFVIVITVYFFKCDWARLL